MPKQRKAFNNLNSGYNNLYNNYLLKLNMKKERAIKQLEELDKQGKSMRLAAEEWDKEWKTLISIILSARTRDETTIKTCKELFKKYNTIEKLSKANLNEIEKIIRPVNFYKNKSKSILKCVKCDSFTLMAIHCGSETINPKPAKYSPEDKYKEYRIKYKKEIKKI